MSNDLEGFYNAANAAPGKPTSRDPEIIKAYEERQRQLTLPGKWRAGCNPDQYPDNGRQTDIDYMILEW